MPEYMDVQVDEARKIAVLQMKLNAKYVGKPKDIQVWSDLRNDLVDGMREIGFIVNVFPDPNRTDMWVPVCEVVGRVDKKLQQYINESGGDIEKTKWHAQRWTSSELQKEGVDTSLLV